MKIQAPAKLNLFLHVVRRRVDGYHELQTLMCCVGLHDTVSFKMGGDQCVITCSHPDLPCDETNLALKAALVFNEALKTETEIKPSNISIHLTKRIPSGAGLGGGSSDAAAVLNELNRYHVFPFSRQRLMAMALNIGADVPFFIEGRPAIATGVGEVLAPYTQLLPWGVVIVYPGFEISTAQVFKNLNLGLTNNKKQLSYSPFKQGKFDAARHLINDLEALAAQQFPVIGDIKKELLNQGAIGSLMTGSGSAVFGLFPDIPSARKAANAMIKSAQWQVYVTQLVC
jgi:4-diphosphocytidyl-2-C-methyl-D-erythritol kinase